MISFDTKAFFKVWDIEILEKFAKVNMQTGRKDKMTDQYINSKWNYVRFVGDAFTKAKHLKQGDKITGVRASLSNEAYVNRDGEKVYPKFYQLTVFDFELADGANNKPAGKPPVDQLNEPEGNDDELPF